MIGEGERIDCCLAIRAERRDGSDVVDACDEPFDERRDTDERPRRAAVAALDDRPTMASMVSTDDDCCASCGGSGGVGGLAAAAAVRPVDPSGERTGDFDGRRRLEAAAGDLVRRGGDLDLRESFTPSETGLLPFWYAREISAA